MSIVTLVVSILALIVAASALFAWSQARKMRKQVQEMQRQFGESGPGVKREGLPAGSKQHTNGRDKHFLYDKCQEPARRVKIILQMIIGALTVVAVATAISISMVKLVQENGSLGDVTTEIFSAVAAGLAAAAAVDLAYALFTPGLDEALDPIILGLSSTFLFLASKSPRIDWQFGVAGILFAAALYGLLKIKERFREILTNDEEKPGTNENDNPRQEPAASPGSHEVAR
jgi:RsiW-degrading membrane proteinase PrsW (M82 family)